MRHTRSQIDLPKHERQLNVQDAFALNDSAVGIDKPKGLSPWVIGSRLSIVVLVDDVSTTGATLEACARVLKAAGVREVRALTAARVVNESR